MRARLDPFYPIVDSAAWVERLAEVGARLIQLRVKDRDEAWVARETRDGLAVCARVAAVLVVNDYWRVAIGEPQGISTLHPASTSRSATTRSSVV